MSKRSKIVHCVRAMILRVVSLERVCVTEVNDLDLHLCADDNIAGSQISPGNLLVVQILAGEKDLGCKIFRNSLLQRSDIWSITSIRIAR